MSGEKNLAKLIQGMRPKLQAGQYVFISMAEPFDFPASEPILTFREEEGITYILPKQVADQHGFSYAFIAAWITLTVHSALEAVGLTAHFSNALAQHQISCNVVAGFYHDHIFVDAKDADMALSILQN